MKSEYAKALEWIEKQSETLLNRTMRWASINSGTHNLEGLAQLLSVMEKDFSSLKANIHRIDFHSSTTELKLGKALHITKREKTSRKVLFSGHMDTVFGKEHSFQEVKLNGKTLHGPGVADMKGGLAILLSILEAFERSPFAEKIGWEVLISPDEEIGSPGSSSLLARAAERNQIGLIFEPSFPDGTIVSGRKGSVNFILSAEGKAAHAGRNFHNGKSAIYALAHAIHKIEKLTKKKSETTVNVGVIQGGTAPNVIPERAHCTINVRSFSQKALDVTKNAIESLVEELNNKKEANLILQEGSARPAKPIDSQTEGMLQHLKECAKEIGFKLQWDETGGCCDGNNLSAAGLPNIDTLGAVGGKIHTDEEYLEVDSLVERTKLTTLFLLDFANGEFNGS